MKIALDTNAYRAIQEGHQLFAELLQTADIVGIPSIVLGEIRAGIAYGSKQEYNTKKLERFLTSSDNVRILVVDESTTFYYGKMFAQLRNSGRPIPTNDIWIAALCQQYGFALATLDSDFKNVPYIQTFGLEI